MKKINLFSNILISIGLIMGLIACEPKEFDKPDVDAVPQSGQVTFTVEQTDTSAFYFVVKNTSAVSGIAHWVIDGAKKTGPEVLMYAPLPGNYKVVLTLVTNGGVGSDTLIVPTTETDWAFLNSPMNKMISGGIDAADGKTWMVDATQNGHFGLGGAMVTPTNWWACPANSRPGSDAYDDEMTLKLVGMVAQLNNHGRSYVNAGYQTNAAFSNPVLQNPANSGDGWSVELTPGSATWSLTPDSVLSFSSGTPFWLGFYNGETSYKILKLTDDLMIVSGNTPGTGNWWQNMYVRKGYVRPTVTYTATLEATANENEYSAYLKSVVEPADLKIKTWSVNFGDGSDVVTSTNKDELQKHTYMRAGKYPVTIKVTFSNDEDASHLIYANIATNHTSYVPFEINTIMLYNDFSEVIVREINGQDCSVTISDNPSVINPNRSSKVAHYSKDKQQWANANMLLGDGYRFNLQTVHTFSMMVYGQAGKKVLLKLENTDMGGDAWTTGTADFIYTIQKDNTWELAVYDFKNHAAGGGNGSHSTADVTTDAIYSKDYYNVVRVMYEPGNNSGAFDFYFDELRGPSVEGIKSLQIK